MKDVYDIRRENLRRLIVEWDGPVNLAAKLGYSNASYLTQLAGPNPIRDISERTARKMEDVLGMPVGVLDEVHDGAAGGPSAVNLDDVTAIARAVGAASESSKQALSPTQFAEVVALAYEHRLATGRIDEGYIHRLLTLCKGSPA